MRRSLRILPAFLLALVVAAACTNAKVGAPSPDGIQVSTNGSIVVAGDNNVAVRAQVFEKGVVLLGQSVTFSVAGAADQVATTSSSTGFALASFSLHTAGAATVTATVVGANGPISASTGVTVIAAPPASLTVAIASQTITADAAAISFTATAKDAYQNVTTDPIGVSVDSPAAAVQGTTVSNLHTAGSFLLRGTVEGFPAVTSSAGFIVLPGLAAQAIANVAQTSVGKLQSLSFSCDEKDAWGNLTSGTFAATTNAFTTPASTITANGSNHFTASSFATTGIYTANCSLGGHSDAKQFQVIAQNATNSVVASLDKTMLQAAATTATLTCSEVDGFGNPAAATLTGSIRSPGGVATALAGSSPFPIAALSTTGIWTATCNDAATALSDTKQFQVVDTTPPTASVSISAATGPNGITPDSHYAPGTTLTLHVTATDNVRVASEAISVTGSAIVIGSDIHAETAATASASHDFQIQLGSTTFSTITVNAMSTDGSGNSAVAPATLTLTVDPAVAFTVSGGVTVRTVYEQPVDIAHIPMALTTSGANLYLGERNAISDEATLVTFPAGTPGTVATLVATDWVPGLADAPKFGLVWVPGGFGAANLDLFTTVQGGGGSIMSFNGTTPTVLTPDPTVPFDLAYGTLGATTGIVEMELSAPKVLNRISGSGAGVTTPFFVDTAGRLSPVGFVIDSTQNLLVVAANRVDVLRIDGTTGQLNTAPFVTSPGVVSDLGIGTGGVILAATGNGTLERYDSLGTTRVTAVTAAGESFLAVTFDAAGNAYLLSDNGSTTRVFKVTGY